MRHAVKSACVVIHLLGAVTAAVAQTAPDPGPKAAPPPAAVQTPSLKKKATELFPDDSKSGIPCQVPGPCGRCYCADATAVQEQPKQRPGQVGGRP